MFERRLTNTITIFCLLAGLTVGCASIMKPGSDQGVTIKSDPDAATISVVDMITNEAIDSGTTPMICTLKKSQGYFKGSKYKVTVEKEGFKQQEVVIESKANGWYIAGNILVGGLIGWLIVDPMTGAMYTLTPEEVSLELLPEDSSYNLRDDELFFVLKELSQISEVNRGRLIEITPQYN